MEQTKLIAETIKQAIRDIDIDKVQGATIGQGINERGLEQMNVTIEFKRAAVPSPQPTMDMAGQYYNSN